MPDEMVKPKEVTFTGKRTGKRVTVRALIVVLNRAMQWLRTLDPDSPVEWEVVRVRMGNPVSLTFSNPNANGAVSSNMGQLSTLSNKRKPKIVPRLTDAIIESTKELGQVLGSDFESLRISSPGEKTVNVTSDLVHRVEEMIFPRPTFRYEWTTIEGEMDQVTAASGERTAKFRITHPITGDDISCTFDQSIVNLDAVKAALPHRVAVYGRAKLDRTRIISIEVERIRQLPDASSFGSLLSLPKTDISGGMESSDYVERVRGGE